MAAYAQAAADIYICVDKILCNNRNIFLQISRKEI